MAILYCGGKRLKQAIIAGSEALNSRKGYLDRLNVFPVPDGDTGVNMSLTLQATIKEIEKLPRLPLEAVAQAAAWGSLIGARGNSGVILAQVFAGFAETVGGASRLYASDIAESFRRAANLAYQAVANPVEGTMLTVIRESATFAVELARSEKDLAKLLEGMIGQAKISLENTPQLLPVLREAGVIDAGGLGFVYFLEGMLKLIRGEATGFEEVEEEPPPMVKVPFEWTNRYCAEFMLEGEALPQAEIKEKLAQMGDSLLMVGSDRLLRVHIHTSCPDYLLDYAATLGKVSAIKVDDMKEQHQGAGQAWEPATSVIAVALGEGLRNIFKSLGADKVVEGGQTMNPPVGELLTAIDQARGSRVILLPNNPTIISVARQAARLSTKEVEVVNCKTIPQGLAAILTFKEDAGLADNLRLMEESLGRVKTGEVTYASRDAQYRGMDIVEGDILGLYNQDIQIVSKSPTEAILGLLERMIDDRDEVITIFYGQGLKEEDVDELALQIEKRFLHKEVEIHFGGQPYTLYLVAIE